MSRQKRLLILLGVMIVFSAVFLSYYFVEIKEKEAQKALPVLGEPGQKVRPFSFLNQEGKTITQNDVAGKVFVANYFFATCKGICPKMNENFSKVYKAVRGDTGVLLLSHTVNPSIDTPAALAAYGRRLDADPKQWMFLTGDKKALYDQARYSYLISASEDTSGISIEDDFIHDQHLVLVDKHGNLRGHFYDGLSDVDIAQLIKDIRVLEKEQ